MARGRKKGEKIGKVHYRLVAMRDQGASSLVVGEKYLSGKPVWADKSAKKVAAGKKQFNEGKGLAKIAKARKNALDKMPYSVLTGGKKRGRPQGSKNKPK